MKLAMSLAVVVLLCACGSGGGSGNSAQSIKGVFAKWSNQNESLDLTGGTFGAIQAMFWGFKNGSICSANLLAVGGDSSGAWSITNATVYSGSDPGCVLLNGNGTYANDGVTLNICQTSPPAPCFTLN